MLQEILFGLIALLIGGPRLIATINRRLNNRRIQRGIVEYLLQKTARKIITR